MEECILTFDELFQIHSAFVWRSVRHLGAPPADVPDLAQDVFIIAHEKFAQLRDAAGARSWLYRICFGVVRNHQRRAHVRRETAEPRPDAAAVPRDPVERGQTRRRLAETLEMLDPDKRAVLVAHAIEEMSVREIAEALSIPIKTVYSRLYAARRRAAEAYETLRDQTASEVSRVES